MINGCLVGMVSICAGVDAYYPWAAGLIAGGLFCISSPRVVLNIYFFAILMKTINLQLQYPVIRQDIRAV